VWVDDAPIALTLGAIDGTRLIYTLDGVSHRADVLRRDDRLWLCAEGITLVYDDVLRQPPATAGDAGDGRVAARMDGKIQRVDVAQGDTVTAGDTLLVLEAMKMEFTVTADIDGKVETLSCAAGDQVAARQLLLVITPEVES